MGWLGSIFKGLLPGNTPGKKRKKKRRARVKLAEGGGFTPSGAGPQSRVLVANLFGAGGKDVSERIVGMVSQESGFATYHFDKALKQNLRSPLLERLLAASEQGSTWLREEKADLLIWGEMEDMGTVAGFVFYLLAQVRMVSPELLGWQTRWICRFQFLTVLAILFAPRPWRHCFPLHLDRRKSSRTV